MSELIFVEQKPMEGREQKLSAGATIGREGCDVNLMDPEVSRRHAAITEIAPARHQREPRVRDLRSARFAPELIGIERRKSSAICASVISRSTALASARDVTLRAPGPAMFTQL